MNTCFFHFSVLQSDTAKCMVTKAIPLTPPEGYLASSLSQLFDIGSSRCPYTFSVPSGKTLSLHIVNFALFSKHRLLCTRVADAIDSTGKTHPISLCRDKPRETEVSDSLPSGDIRIEMADHSTLKQAGNFLLRYKGKRYWDNSDWNMCFMNGCNLCPWWQNIVMFAPTFTVSLGLSTNILNWQK